MNALGVYFGPKSVDIVAAKGKKLNNFIRIPLSDVQGSDLEDKVPLEIKIVALINEALRMNKVEAKEAVLSLSGKDLIVRTFEIPNLPKDEIAGAISFEAKKYIPFKVEELISDYQVTLEKSSHVNTVLFVGIKKEILDKYFSIFNQLNIKISRIEYSGFSIARVLKLSGVKDKGVMGLLCVDSGDGDEINFAVTENGFPLFNRDINLSLGLADDLGQGQAQVPVSLEKLNAEIRVSLDYYKRKFPGKNIQNFFVFANRDQYHEVEASLKELGFASRVIDSSKLIGKPIAYSSGLIKGYGASLCNTVADDVKINLAERKAQGPQVGTPGMRIDTASLFKSVKIDYRMVILGGLICAAAFGYGIYQAIPLQNELNNVISSRIKVENIDNNLSSQGFNDISEKYRIRLSKLDDLIKKQLYVTEALDSIPRSIPSGIWLTKLVLDKKGDGKAELILEGLCYLKNSDKEFEAVNKFLTNLRLDLVFAKYFTDLSIASINQVQVDKVYVTSFSLSCRNFKEGR
ncbi:MAG: pilus assembly protein PilM [Candidatus Omnitrophota bacterium]|jgi:Tfp pilus assembly PilM family ATPase|nr:pilus assembly protein PilM [Candidatus Omnitrophota bacterium]